MRNISTRLIILLMLSIVLFGLGFGCLGSGPETKNSTLSNNTSNTSSTPVTSAPAQIYVKAGDVGVVDYDGHHIEVEYTIADSINSMEVKTDGASKVFQKKLEDDPAGIYWEENGLHYGIKPVIWETRDTQEVPIYEESWNTTEIYVEVWK
jgi:hypothetical protein